MKAPLERGLHSLGELSHGSQRALTRRIAGGGGHQDDLIESDTVSL